MLASPVACHSVTIFQVLLIVYDEILRRACAFNEMLDFNFGRRYFGVAGFKLCYPTSSSSLILAKQNAS